MYTKQNTISLIVVYHVPLRQMKYSVCQECDDLTERVHMCLGKRPKLRDWRNLDQIGKQMAFRRSFGQRHCRVGNSGNALTTPTQRPNPECERQNLDSSTRESFPSASCKSTRRTTWFCCSCSPEYRKL